MNNKSLTGTEIAVIGISCKFPNSKNHRDYWKNLIEGKECVNFLTAEEISSLNANIKTNPKFVNGKGGILEDKNYFDYSFFDYLHSEAELLHPQTRIFHECVWGALEDGGYRPDSFHGNIGLYAGASSSFFWEANSLISRENNGLGSFEAETLSNKDFLSSRISYKLNLKGPSINIQTTCSTSLVAIHQACRGLLLGECKLALAGGVSLMPKQLEGYLYNEGMIYSKDGRCRPFDNEASGTIPGEGVGVVLLKLLKTALEDKDHIYAVVKGSSINNDGNRKVGYSAPSIEGQAEVIKSALKIAKVLPETITYVETHGTATLLGDPVEIEALKLGYSSNNNFRCAIGSVKANIGHLDAAAGVAGFIKAVLSLYYKIIPPSINYSNPNPKINLGNSNFYINNSLTHWIQKDGLPLRAGVSSFGIGGTNAHIILEEVPCSNNDIMENEIHHLILISARTEESLIAQKKSLNSHLNSSHNIAINDLAYTLGVGRSHWNYRKSIIAKDIREFNLALEDTDEVNTNYVEENSSIIFMFPGQGSEYVKMGFELYSTDRFFKEEIDACFKILGQNFKEIIYPSNDNFDKSEISQTKFTQPLLFCFEYSLAKLLIRYGINPQAMIGHSLGEFVAACIAGVFSLEDAIKLVLLRGEIMQNSPKGSMITVGVSLNDVSKILVPKIDIAAINSERNIVLSGSDEGIELSINKIKELEYPFFYINKFSAFHSNLMDSIAEKFFYQIQSIKFNNPTKSYISTVTGNWVNKDEVTRPEYWANQMRNPVLFNQGIESLLSLSNPIFIEVGPGNSLCKLIQSHISSNKIFNLIKNRKESLNDHTHFLKLIGKFWEIGMPIDTNLFYPNTYGKRISLPTYIFEKSKFTAQDFINNKTLISSTVNSFVQDFKESEPHNWFFTQNWVEQFVKEVSDIKTISKFNWLIFYKESYLTQQLISQLQQFSKNVVIVRPNVKYAKENINNFFIDPSIKENFDSLIEDIGFLQDDKPLKIINLWGVDDKIEFELTLDGFKEIQNELFFGLFYLTQAIGKLSTAIPLEIFMITNHFHSVLGIETINPAKSTLLGPIKIIPLEYSNIKCYNIDIDDSVKVQNIIQHLLNPDNIITAFRGPKKWTQIIQNVSLSEKKNIPNDQIFLITGGLGGIGFAIAEFLAINFKAKIGIITKSFPEKTQWEKYRATHSDTDPISVKISKLLALEKLGAIFLIFSADVSDFDKLSKAVECLESSFGLINGVIHAAGIPDYGGVIQRRNKESIMNVMESKVSGAINLDRIFHSRDLNFFILFSSNANIDYKIKFGQLAYNSANEFLESFALYKNIRDKYFTHTINWTDWKEVGMSVKALKNSLSSLEHTLKDALTNEEGIDVFLRVVAYPITTINVSKEDLNHLMMKRSVQIDNYKKGIIKQESNKGKRLKRPPIKTKYVSPRNLIETKVCNIFEDFFFIEKIGIYDDFFEMGGDSLKALSLLSIISKKIGFEIPIHTIYSNSTVISISDYIINSRSNSLLNSFNDEFSLLTSPGKTNIFCFPPALGLAISYKNFSKLMEEYSIYAFNYLDSEQRYLQYLSIIKSIDQQGPYILLGYSAGGGMVFEMAKTIEENGLKVSDIILLDTYVYRSLNKDEDFLLLDKFLLSVENSLNEHSFEISKEEILHRIRKYFLYSNNLISEKAINANIHLITATDRNEIERKNISLLSESLKERVKTWDSLTKGIYYEYKGFGTHQEMMDGNNLKMNIDLIKDILTKIR